MSRPFTLLEDLCRHALSIGSDSIEVEYRDDREWVYGRKDNTSVSFASFASSSADAKELRDNLYRAHKKPLRTVLDGKVYALKARIADSFGEDAFAVKIEPAPKLDPTAAPRFTKTQGQYLTFHILLHEDPWLGSRRIGSPELLPGFRAIRPRDDQDP